MLSGETLNLPNDPDTGGVSQSMPSRIRRAAASLLHFRAVDCRPKAHPGFPRQNPLNAEYDRPALSH